MGSGKTTVQIEKIRYLHEKKDVPLERMTILTFTNKAADEIGTQIVACIPRNGDIQRAEARGGTVFECLAESPMHAVYNDLADRVLDMTQDEKGEQQVC